MQRRGPNQLIPDYDGAARYLPWVIAVMVFLGALAIAVSASLNQAVNHVENNVRGTITVELPAVGAESEARTKRALALLRSTAGIVAVEALKHDDMVALLEPWLGSGNVTSDLPIPQLIDVTLDQDYPADLGFLSQRLQKEVPGARIDDHQVWLGKFTQFAQVVRWLTLGAIALVVMTITVVVMFSARASLASHRAIVELLHLIGAHDKFIAEHFQKSALKLGLKGGLIGLVFAGLVIVSLSYLVVGLLPGATTVSSYLLLAASLVMLPLVAAAVSALTVRLTVMWALKRMP